MLFVSISVVYLSHQEYRRALKLLWNVSVKPLYLEIDSDYSYYSSIPPEDSSVCLQYFFLSWSWGTVKWAERQAAINDCLCLRVNDGWGLCWARSVESKGLTVCFHCYLNHLLARYFIWLYSFYEYINSAVGSIETTDFLMFPILTSLWQLGEFFISPLQAFVFWLGATGITAEIIDNVLVYSVSRTPHGARKRVFQENRS